MVGSIVEDVFNKANGSHIDIVRDGLRGFSFDGDGDEKQNP